MILRAINFEAGNFAEEINRALGIAIVGFASL
jgi:hypothetical protein